MKAVVSGTVFSGHPTRTTFGNTLRVITYMKYIFSLGQIDKYGLFVCGDDVLGIIENEQKELFEGVFYRVYTTDKTANFHGLG